MSAEYKDSETLKAELRALTEESRKLRAELRAAIASPKIDIHVHSWPKPLPAPTSRADDEPKRRPKKRARK